MAFFFLFDGSPQTYPVIIVPWMAAETVKLRIPRCVMYSFCIDRDQKFSWELIWNRIEAEFPEERMASAPPRCLSHTHAKHRSALWPDMNMRKRRSKRQVQQTASKIRLETSNANSVMYSNAFACRLTFAQESLSEVVPGRQPGGVACGISQLQLQQPPSSSAAQQKQHPPRRFRSTYENPILRNLLGDVAAPLSRIRVAYDLAPRPPSARLMLKPKRALRQVIRFQEHGEVGIERQ